MFPLEDSGDPFDHLHHLIARESPGQTSLGSKFDLLRSGSNVLIWQPSPQGGVTGQTTVFLPFSVIYQSGQLLPELSLSFLEELISLHLYP